MHAHSNARARESPLRPGQGKGPVSCQKASRQKGPEPGWEAGKGERRPMSDCENFQHMDAHPQATWPCLAESLTGSLRACLTWLVPEASFSEPPRLLTHKASLSAYSPPPSTAALLSSFHNLIHRSYLTSVTHTGFLTSFRSALD